jgi:hypothetical protein
MNTLTASALKAAAEAGQDRAKPAAAASDGTDSQADKEKERKE